MSVDPSRWARTGTSLPLAYAGHYRNENPWEGTFCPGEEEDIPDRIRFADVVNGRALRAFISGSEYTRIET